MTAALLFLKNYYKYIAVAAIVAAIGLYWYHLTSTISNQETKITQLTTANEILEGNVKTLEASIDSNNKAIKMLGDGADKTKSDFATLNSTVGTQIAALAPRLDAIKKGVKPVSCPDTMRYLLDARKELK